MTHIEYSKRPKLKSPYLIVAWPGMGEVAYRAAMYLVESLKAEQFARLLPKDFFYQTGTSIQDGILFLPELPAGTFYFWKNKTGKNDLIIFVSNAQPDLAHSSVYCEQILSVAKAFKTKLITCFAAMPQPIEHTQTPNVWVAVTAKKMLEDFRKYNFSFLTEGQISGMNGLFLGIAKEQGFAGFCLLGEIPLYTIQIENPKASYAVLEAFNKIVNIQVALVGLVEQAHIIEGEINKLLDYLKFGPQADAPIGEEEIEKIKKTLSQLTKLPVSVKEKIEKLFAEAKVDMAKAHELKVELDRWNAYKEYEDRFLDLFKKAKGKDN